MDDVNNLEESSRSLLQSCMCFGCLIHQKPQISWFTVALKQLQLDWKWQECSFLAAAVVSIKSGKIHLLHGFPPSVGHRESSVRARVGGFASCGSGRLPNSSLLILRSHHHYHRTCMQNLPKKNLKSSPTDILGQHSPSMAKSINSRLRQLKSCLWLIVRFSPSGDPAPRFIPGLKYPCHFIIATHC